MKYLDALKLIQFKKECKKKTLKIYSSALTDPLDIFIKAFFLKKKIDIQIYRNSFNTLNQVLLTENFEKDTLDYKTIILFPWDFIPDLDWRTGINKKNKKYENFDLKVKNLSNILKRIKKSKVSMLYFNFPVPEILINENENSKLRYNLISKANIFSNIVNKEKIFDLEKYVDIGCPFNSLNLSFVARKIVSSCGNKKFLSLKIKPFKNKFKKHELKIKKVIATDFYGLLWKGLIGEDGPKKIFCDTDAKGFMHNFYQDLLLKLKDEGVILIGVTKNTTKDANLGLKNIHCKLKKKDFVKIFASYQPKSSQLIAALKSLNLSQDDLLFIDDNNVEIAEVRKNLPKCSCLQFPKNFEYYSEFIKKINLFFTKNIITKEDTNRTTNYKEILKTTKILNKSKGIEAYLDSLDMSLIIKRRMSLNIDRAIQLINKTNQFNINGLRLSKKKILNIVSKKGNLFTGFYKDNTGDYGEIIALLTDAKGNVLTFVMSCRVFQRNIEHAFLYEIIKRNYPIKKINYRKTEKNQPAYNFLTYDLVKTMNKDMKFINKNKYIDLYKNKYNLFNIKFN